METGLLQAFTTPGRAAHSYQTCTPGNSRKPLWRRPREAEDIAAGTASAPSAATPVRSSRSRQQQPVT